MKSLSFLFVALFLLFAIGNAQNPDQDQLKSDIHEIEQVMKGTKDLHSSLTEVKQQVDELASTARGHQFDNMLKTYLKGMNDVYGLLYDGPSTALGFLQAALINIYLEPVFTKSRKAKINIENLKIRQTQYTGDLSKMYEVLKNVIQSDLPRFDDDQPPFDFTARNWRNPDKKTDDEAELITRKLFVIVGLCEDISNKIVDVTKQLREDYVSWDTVLQDNKRILANLEKEETLNRQIAERHKERMQQFAREEQAAENREKMSQEAKDKQANTREMDDRTYMAVSVAKEQQEYVTRWKAGLEKGKNARISYVVTTEGDLTTAQSVFFKAEVTPEDAFGEIIWKVDDATVASYEFKPGTNRELRLTYAFTEPGIYDVSAGFYVNGDLVDQHMGQVTINSKPEAGMTRSQAIMMQQFGQKPGVQPKPEKVQIVDLPYSKYWVSGLKGQEVISGYYFNMTGQRLEYQSKKLMDFNFQNPAYGLFALASLNGYHVYRTLENDKPLLVVALLGQKGTELKQTIPDVVGFEVNIAPDFSKAEIRYKTGQGISNQLVLM